MKQEIKQDIKIAVCAALTLLLLVLTVLEIFPGKQTDLTIKETVTVSPSLVSTASATYENAISGVLFNDSSDTLSVDAISVTVGNGKDEKTIKIPFNREIAPRTTEEFSVSITDTVAYTSVEDVTAQIEGKYYILSNVKQGTVGAVTLILIALLVLLGFLLYRNILIRYYMYQEKQLTN